MKAIHDRPAVVETRPQFGHWEGDLIIGAGHRSAIATLVERKARHTILVPIRGGHSAINVGDALVDVFSGLPPALRRTLTWDQGNEMFHHERIESSTGIGIYFADPHSPWQRGSNENTYWYKMAGPESLRRESLWCGQPGDSENTCRQAFR